MNRAARLAKKANGNMDWADEAACKDTPLDIWFTELGFHADQEAIRICNRCPVINQCRDYAINNDQTDGIWGGMTPDQRFKHSRKRKARHD
jgi:hypothetical protein